MVVTAAVEVTRRPTEMDITLNSGVCVCKLIK